MAVSSTAAAAVRAPAVREAEADCLVWRDDPRGAGGQPVGLDDEGELGSRHVFHKRQEIPAAGQIARAA